MPPPAESVRPPITIGDVTVRAGRRAKFEIPVGRLPAGADIEMPVAVIHGRHDGPGVWLSAAIHGDEINGVEIIHDVLPRIDARSLHGTVIAVPVVNVFGFTIRSRYLPDRRDLNRSFPGSRRGSLASRLARLFLDTIVEPCEFGIDYHTGSDHRANWPQVRADLDDAETTEAALAFGAHAVLDSRLRDGSLRQAARERGKRVLLYEGGEPERFDAEVTEIGVEGTLRVLRHLGMIRGSDVDDGDAPLVFRSSRWMRARRGGIARFAVDLGDAVDEGEVLAEIYDVFGARPTKVRAGVAGHVIGIRRRPLVNAGDAIVHLGLEE